MKWKIPLYKVDWDKEDVRSVTNVIKRGMDWAIGPEIEEFEKELKIMPFDGMNPYKIEHR